MATVVGVLLSVVESVLTVHDHAVDDVALLIESTDVVPSTALAQSALAQSVPARIVAHEDEHHGAQFHKVRAMVPR